VVDELVRREVWRLPREEAAAKTDGHGVRSVSRAQLGTQVTHVGLHGLSGDDKPLGDLVILEALCDQLQDFEFATCELFHRRAALTSSGNMRLFGPLPLPRYPGEATLTANVLERSVTQRPNHRNRDVAVAIAATLALPS
jgi:hypothetical protein